jgi:hypothetical protein
MGVNTHGIMVSTRIPEISDTLSDTNGQEDRYGSKHEGMPGLCGDDPGGGA